MAASTIKLGSSGDSSSVYELISILSIKGCDGNIVSLYKLKAGEKLDEEDHLAEGIAVLTEQVFKEGLAVLNKVRMKMRSEIEQNYKSKSYDMLLQLANGKEKVIFSNAIKKNKTYSSEELEIIVREVIKTTLQNVSKDALNSLKFNK